MAERIVTRAIILDNKDRVLLGIRDHGSGKGQWALVGGKPDKEKEETPLQTLAREVSEELRRNFIKPIFWKEITDSESVPGEKWRVYFYIGRIDGEPDPNPDEITETDWFEKNKIGELNIAFNHKEILMEFFANR